MSSQWFAIRDRDRSTGHAPTLLVVDDEQFIRTVLELYFETEGFEVLLAQNGEEALRDFEDRKGKIDIIILDLGMPGMHGLEVLRRLKGVDPTVEVIIATGCGSLQTAAEALSLGAFDYVTKPIVNLAQDLLPVVRKALASREAKLLEMQKANGAAEPTRGSWGRLAIFDDLETLARQTADPVSADEAFQTLGAILAQHFLAEEIVAVGEAREHEQQPLATWTAAPPGAAAAAPSREGRVVAWRLPFRAACATAETLPATLLVYANKGREFETDPPAAGLIVLLLERLFAHATTPARV